MPLPRLLRVSLPLVLLASAVCVGLGLGLEPFLQRQFPVWFTYQAACWLSPESAGLEAVYVAPPDADGRLWGKPVYGVEDIQPGRGQVWISYSTGHDGKDDRGRGDDVLFYLPPALNDGQSILWELAHWPMPLLRLAALWPTLWWLSLVVHGARSPRAEGLGLEVVRAAGVGTLPMLALAWHLLWDFVRRGQSPGFFGTSLGQPLVWGHVASRWTWASAAEALDEAAGGHLLVRPEVALVGVLSLAVMGAALWWRLRQEPARAPAELPDPG